MTHWREAKNRSGDKIDALLILKRALLQTRRPGARHPARQHPKS